VRVFNRHGVEKDERAMAIEREEIQRLAKDRDDEQSILDRNIYGAWPRCCAARSPLPGRRASEGRRDRRRGASTPIRGRSGGSSHRRRRADDGDRGAPRQYDESRKRLESRFIDKVEKLQRGDELPPAS
jgi:DNA-directed RNA polymerase subunit beta